MLYADVEQDGDLVADKSFSPTDSPLIPVNGLTVVCCMQDVEQDGDLVADKSFSH